ncbi:7178_t:CDS:1 [Paraglomus brasilianum]|uniref:7178_t:CDS:1 n=1 Tax=Paraglomus brasilianum TaxID=144538 RepID=A0A9N9AVG1_9GLOM|nr:7178_t:CDS:1 [Paraglomus brasilianum]
MLELLTFISNSIFVALLTIVIHKVYVFLKWRKSADSIPGPPASLLTGNILDIGRAGGLAPYLQYLHKTYGPVVKYWSTPNELHVTINEPNILEQLDIMTTERPFNFIEFLRGFFGDKGLIYLYDEPAKARRLTWHKTFAKRPYEKIIPRFIEIINKRGTDWLSKRNGEKSAKINVQAEARSLWNKLNEYNVFGDASTSDNLSVKFEETIELLLQIRFSFAPVLPYTEIWRKRKELLDYVRHEVQRLIKEQLDRRGEFLANGNDFLSLLLNDEELTEESFFDEVLTLLFVVTDNFMGVANLLHQLAEHKDVQERVRKEVQNVWGDKFPTTVDDLSCLTYTRAVVKEVLRFCGTSNITLRKLQREYFIQNKYHIPKDALIMVPLSIIHRNPNHWNEPDKFNPDRFLEESRERSRMAFVPFGFGARSCLGQRYAMNTLTLIAGLMVKRFDIESITRYDDVVWKESIFSIHASDGIWLNFIPRMVE